MNSVNIMCMGDSITFGEQGGYRVFLKQMLEDAGISHQFCGSKKSFGPNEGYPGFKIADLIYGKSSEDYGTSQKIEITLTKYRPCMLLLLLGTNDMYFADPDEAAAELDTIISKAIETLPNLHVFAASILPILPGEKPWGAVIPEDVGMRVTKFNRNVSKLAEKHRNNTYNVCYIDIASCLESTDQLLADGVHPDRELYRNIAQCWFDGIDQVVGSRCR